MKRQTLEGFLISMIIAAVFSVACVMVGLAGSILWDVFNHDEQRCYDARNFLAAHQMCLDSPNCHATQEDFVFAEKARNRLARCKA